jgi:putative transposase
MKENNVVELSGRVEGGDALTALLRSGAKELIRQAVDAELQELLASHADRLTDAGRAGWCATAFCQSDSCKRVLAR